MKSSLALNKNVYATRKNVMKTESLEMSIVQNAKGMDLSLTMQTRNKNKDKTEIVYDLNIFQRELLDADGEYRHAGPWYVHIYEYMDGNVEELSAPIQLTWDEYNSLIANDPYFQDHEPDLWYGLEGFMKDKWDSMSDGLKLIFESLPKYKDLPTLK
jgi:hypothetical protein